MISIGFDVGGTFTDLMLFDDSSGSWSFEKVRTTGDDQARGCLDGLRRLLENAGVRPEDVDYIAHGTTVATNTLVERKGARAALLTTTGFRDVLEIRRQVMPHRYDVGVPKPTPLIPRSRRIEVDERTLADGGVEQPISTSALRSTLDALAGEGVEALAVCFLHAYANPANEDAAKALAETMGGWHVTASHEVLNEHREYERTATVVANAYVAPPMRRYLDALTGMLRDAGISAPLLLFQSNGGLFPIAQARETPIACLLSGPAAGLIAAASVAREHALNQVVSLDMGGTSCDVALVDGGPRLAYEQEIAGWPIRTPRLDIHSVGAGGGSIAWVDGGGLLRVGPQSAGAVPGPASYGTGGTRPTVTDAHVVLGRLGINSRLAGGLRLDADAARRTVGALGDQLSLDPVETANGILEVVNATMVHAIRLISIEQGHDPRTFSLVAFGGAGALHACDIARSMGLRDVVIPPRPGLLCALGLLVADMRIDGSASRRIALDGADAVEAIRSTLLDLETQVRDSTAVTSRPDAGWTPSYRIDMRYVGQSFDVGVPVTAAELRALDAAELAARFDAAHEAAYGHANPRAPKVATMYRVWLTARSGVGAGQLPRIEHGGGDEASRRDVYFSGWVRDCPVIAREALRPGDTVSGPAIVEQLDTTIAIPPDFVAEVDGASNIVLTPTGVAHEQARAELREVVS